MDPVPRTCTLLAILALATTACAGGPLSSGPTQVEQPQPEDAPQDPHPDASASLCEVVTSISTTHDDAARTLRDEPEAPQVAMLYRELSHYLERAAELLEDEQGATATARLAGSYEAAAAFYRTHGEAPGSDLAAGTADAPALRSLEERRADGGPLGFPPTAWAEIDQRCEVAVDPPADP